MFQPDLTQLPNEEKRTFITNFYDNVLDIQNLLISDAIWKKYGFTEEPITIIKKILDDQVAYLYIDDSPVIKIFTDFENGKWTLHVKKEY